MFGFIKKKRKHRSEEFIKSLPNKDNGFLLQAYSALDCDSLLGIGNEFTGDEIRAVENELNKRGFVYQKDY